MNAETRGSLAGFESLQTPGRGYIMSHTLMESGALDTCTTVSLFGMIMIGHNGTGGLKLSSSSHCAFQVSIISPIC